MNNQKVARGILRYLFKAYLKGPSIIYNINSAVQSNKVNVVNLSDEMLERAWIRERWIYPGDVVACRITILGIEEVYPTYVRTKLSYLMGSLADAGGSKDLMEILEYKIEEYSIALDLVKQLELLQVVEIRHQGDSFVIQLTDKGWLNYEKGRRTFFTLVA
ncbi:MAG TPA: hypothetical protein VD816_09335 [Ohtaekwangia sp.]|nr:hypothetical protein [Ohtaekwangia sp.]